MCERFARPRDAMRASPRATAMSERAWGWRPGHAWGLSYKLDATLRGPFHTVPCELSVALTSRQIGCWGFLGRQGVADPVHCEWPDSSICEHSWRSSCADVSLAPGASCACGLARSRSDPDRVVHTSSPIPPSRVHTVFLYFFKGASIDRLSPFEVHARMAGSECCSIQGGPFIPRPGLGSILFCFVCPYLRSFLRQPQYISEAWLQLWAEGRRWAYACRCVAAVVPAFR